MFRNVPRLLLVTIWATATFASSNSEFKRITLWQGISIHEMGGMSLSQEQDVYMLYGVDETQLQKFPQMRSRIGYWRIKMTGRSPVPGVREK